MNNGEIMGPLGDFVSRSAHLKYRGVSLGTSLKVPFCHYLLQKWQCEGFPRRLFGRTLRVAIVALHRLLLGFRATRCDLNRLRQTEDRKTGRVIVLCDHSGPHVDMVAGITNAFDKGDLIFITLSAPTYEHLRSQFPNCLYVGHLIRRLQWRHAPCVWRYFSALRVAVGLRNVHFWCHILPAIGSVVQATDFYHKLYDSIGVSALITLSDAHWHEFVATSVARQVGIPTYTNQHGEFVDLPLYVPIASDKIFVWGEQARRYLLAHGMPPEQVVAAGNPKFDGVFSRSSSQVKAMREKVRRTLELKRDRLTVTLLGSGFAPVCEAPTSEREIFEAFCLACGSTVNRVVKLHPRDDLSAHREWASRLGIDGKVVFLQEENLHDVLSVTDIAVSFLSTSGLEALGFGIPVIIVNFIDGIDVEDYITFAKDVLPCRSRREFSSTLASLIQQPDRLQSEIERIEKVRGRYFSNARHGNSAAVIREFITAENVERHQSVMER